MHSGAICALSWVILEPNIGRPDIQNVFLPPPPPPQKTPRIYTVLKNDPGGHKKHGKSRIRGKFSSLLLAQITLFEELAVEDPPFFAAVLSNLKASLNSLTEMKARGAQIRSRSFYLDTEEKPCSYFLRRESAKSKDKFIFELCDDSGRLFRDPLSLQRVCREFYRDLLSEHPVDDNSIVAVRPISPARPSQV